MIWLNANGTSGIKLKTKSTTCVNDFETPNLIRTFLQKTNQPITIPIQLKRRAIIFVGKSSVKIDINL